MTNFFSRRGRDGGENKEPEEEKKAQPARPFSSSRLSGGDSPPARSGGGGSGDDEKKSTSERGTPFGRSSMFSRSETEKKEDSEEPRARPAGLSGRTPPPERSGSSRSEPPNRFGSRSTSENERTGRDTESPYSRRFDGEIRRSTGDSEERKQSDSPYGSRYETRRDTEERREGGDSASRFGSSHRRPETGERRETTDPGSRTGSWRSTEEKKEEPPSRFGTIRREPDKPPEKKDEPAGGSRFGSMLRRSPAEEKKEEPPSRFGTSRREPEKKDEPAGGSRFGSMLRRSPAEEKKEAPKPPSTRASTADRPASPSITTKAPSTRASTAPAKPATPAARPKSNRAAAKPLPTGKDRLPKLVKAGPSVDFQLDMVGAALVVVALILLSGFISPGAATGVVDDYLAQLFGIGRLLVPIVVGGVGAWLLVSRFGNAMFDIEYFRIFGAMLLFIVVMATLQWGYLLTEVVPSYDVLEQNSDALWRDGKAGGILGHIVYIFSARQLGDIAVVVFFFFWWALALMLLFKTSPGQLVEQGRNVRHSLQVRQEAARARREARRVDITALATAAAAEATAPPQRMPQTAAGRTTTPEQDQTKAAETTAAPVRQIAETQTPEEKPSRLGRLFRGNKIEAEAVETEGRPATSEAAQEQRQRRFGLPGRR
ncbi:MAG: hypothetical protein K8I82_28310, partial [Anaerolineae bacterium]|nr:hypothetical protein [Anaerolineae bacterium]